MVEPSRNKRIDWSIRSLSSDELPSAVSLLVKAFATPLEIRWVAGADDGRDGSDARLASYSQWLMQYLMSLVKVAGGDVIGAFTSLSSDGPAAVAIVFPPGADGQAISHVRAAVDKSGPPPMWLPGGGWDTNAKERHKALARVSGEVHRHAVGDKPHWYLNILGTDPAQQGSGAGIALLSHLTSAAATSQNPLYLETAGERNQTFYMRRGFRVDSKMVIETGVCPPFDVCGGMCGMIVDVPSSKL
eukprot:TRINITY_DN45064_c0_g1_i1.p1 TRINITY_DN45064_c0_g1~~TRINITY_DN45064_c0_g1_i1.p1  ORF type:complete len:245 (-),score=35.60 TRINITY_DN45064_c0_g1_i1:74-808(-)